MTRSPRARLRETHPDEIDGRLVPFYNSAVARGAAGGLVPRTAAEHRWAAERGLHFVVDLGGEVVAAAGCYPLGSGDALEMGNTLVAEGCRGYGLQRELIRARVASVLLTFGTDATLITGCLPGSASYRNCLASGFEPWRSPDPTLYDLCWRTPCDRLKAAIGEGRRCCCEFLRLGSGRREAVVASLLEAPSELLLQAQDERMLRLMLDYGPQRCSGCRHRLLALAAA